MKRFPVKAELSSPLVVRRERQSQRSEGAQYIGGTLLRGAFAQVYLQGHGQADETFRRLFVADDACRFGPLDPGPRVFPLTAKSCKRHPGFGKSGHGVVDWLAALVRSRLSAPPAPPGRCAGERCGQDMKGHTGFWDVENGQPTDAKRRWRRSMAAHVGIDRYTHTAGESIFYTLPALEPSPAREGDQAAPVLHGWLDAPDDAVEVLRNLLAREDHLLRIGHARTRGYGRVRVTIAEAVPPEPANWSDWNAAIRAHAAPNLADPEDCFLFSVSLPNGAVLLDQLLRYTLDPAGMVSWLAPLPPPDLAARTQERVPKPFEGGELWCVTAVAHHERLRGWNAAHGLPRQDEWAVGRGSVYAYLYRGKAAGRAALVERLRELQAQGIGARRKEGFGRVVICDDFHTRFMAEGAT